MDTPQSIVSPFKNSVVLESEKQKPDFFTSAGVNRTEVLASEPENFIGVLDVYVHQARDIHNICIYHKQDVYAKVCLTSDPDSTVSTKIINGGGQNPVFDDNLSLNVRTVDTSLKCEIFMMSRVKNYLEDQLLGFALVPFSEVLLKNGKLEKEFPLSSTDLFHSPAGFVRLSIAYTGSAPDVMLISVTPPALPVDEAAKDSEVSESLPSEFDKIDFPDPQIVDENEMMVSEYIGIPCSGINLNSESSESFSNSDAESPPRSEMHVSSIQAPKPDSPPSSVSTNGVSSRSADGPATSKAPSQKQAQVPSAEERNKKVGDGDSDSSGTPKETNTKPFVSVNIEPEQKVVQQEIVDMYMKSMQQFTESLAKMTLPNFDGSEASKSEKSSSDEKLETPKNSSSRVFYGSSAFF